MRLDVYLATYYPEFSRSVWQKYIARGCVSVGGVVEKVAKTILGEDDEVSFELPKKPDYTDRTLPVIYEDEDVIVIDKPAGILTHSKGELNDEFTVAEYARAKTAFKADTNRPGIVHRLDRDTSGVMIIAKTEAAAVLLQRQFSQRTVKKTYVAVTSAVPKQPNAVIDAPIGRNPKQPSTFRVDPKGKPALTRYEVVAETSNTALVMLRPRTGRTHQLRVHMAYVNAPIKGDKIYGTQSDRLYLHAHKLEVTLPGGKRTVFESAVPAEFTTPFGTTGL